MEKKASRELYKAARTMNDIETLTSGSPKKIKERKEQAARQVTRQA
jgi:hypothetical protein